MRRTAAVALLASVLALAAACGDADRPNLPAARALPEAICGPIAYGGTGSPQGPQTDHGVQNAQAAKMVLAQRGWRAGRFNVGVQVCDEATASTTAPSPTKCARNARAFANDPSVVAVLGPVTSACAHAMLPITNRAPGGPLAVISMSDTYLGLMELLGD